MLLVKHNQYVLVVIGGFIFVDVIPYFCGNRQFWLVSHNMPKTMKILILIKLRTALLSQLQISIVDHFFVGEISTNNDLVITREKLQKKIQSDKME